VTDGAGRPVLVWDMPTRLFHWSTLALFLAEYLTWRLNWMVLHAWAGDTLLALLFFRILWGFFGSESARFRRFIASPRAALRHLASILERAPDHEVGHNPAGGWMVLLILVLLLGQVLTGIYINNDVAVEGPFSELLSARTANLITDMHTVLWYALLAAVALHLLAIVVYAAVKRQNLLMPMITGVKNLPYDVPAPLTAPRARALVALACAAAAASLLANCL
jgi:cytochrome b